MSSAHGWEVAVSRIQWQVEQIPPLLLSAGVRSGSGGEDDVYDDDWGTETLRVLDNAEQTYYWSLTYLIELKKKH